MDYRFLSSGDHIVTLSVTDGEFIQSDSCRITVESRPNTNQKPIADIGEDIEAKQWEWITFTAEKSYDPDGDELKFSWNFGDGNLTNMRMPGRPPPVPGGSLAQSYPKDIS